jgi:hypothetical protein
VNPIERLYPKSRVNSGGAIAKQLFETPMYVKTRKKMKCIDEQRMPMTARMLVRKTSEKSEKKEKGLQSAM